ncbi:MAG: hypothetical protein LBQ34_07665 [Alphaproteobacteria bacterium]|jgi:hypothetical protein|nr:hypothetical protein [Alphaproteobacteria bacterium]
MSEEKGNTGAGTPAPTQPNNPATSAANNISISNEQMAYMAELFAKASAEANKNNPATTEDPFKAMREKEEADKAHKENIEQMSAMYAEVLAEFKPIMKDGADEYLNAIQHYSLTDRMDALAREVIRKHLGDTDSTKVLLDSLKGQSVSNSASAFNVYYKEAIKGLKDIKNPFFVATAGTKYTSKDLEAISNNLFNYKTRDQALETAKNLKLLTA